MTAASSGDRRPSGKKLVAKGKRKKEKYELRDFFYPYSSPKTLGQRQAQILCGWRAKTEGDNMDPILITPIAICIAVLVVFYAPPV